MQDETAACRTVCTMSLSIIRTALEPAIRRALHLYWRFARGMTLGVRGMVIDATGRVFLVRHGYVAGWHLPGGGVETGESALEALRRELREEGQIEIDGTPSLFGFYFNRHVSRRDHVALYVIRDFHQPRLPVPNREIIACGFFDPASLPPGTTAGTRQRIAEVMNALPPAEDWVGA